MFETSTKFAALFCICFEEGNARFLRFIKGYSVQLLSPSLMRNIGSACGIVGTAQGADAAGKPSKLSPAPVVLLKLRKGTILLDATNTNQATSTSPLVQNISCSFSLSATTVPLPIIKGTGAYKAVKGSLTASIDLGGITPFYKAGANKGKCDFSNKYLPLASYFNEVAYGTITY